MMTDEEISQLKSRVKHLEYMMLLIQNTQRVGFLGICVNHASHPSLNHPHYLEDPRIDYGGEIIYKYP